MEVDDNSLLIVGNPQGILEQKLRPHPSDYLNIIIVDYLILTAWVPNQQKGNLKGYYCDKAP